MFSTGNLTAFVIALCVLMAPSGRALAVGPLLFYEYRKQRTSLTSEEPQVRTAIFAADGTI